MSIRRSSPNAQLWYGLPFQAKRARQLRTARRRARRKKLWRSLLELSPVSPVYVWRAPRTFSDLPEIVEFSLGSYPPKGESEERAQGNARVGTKSYFLLPGRRRLTAWLALGWGAVVRPSPGAVSNPQLVQLPDQRAIAMSAAATAPKQTFQGSGSLSQPAWRPKRAMLKTYSDRVHPELTVWRSKHYQEAGIGSLTHRRSHPSCMQFENFVSPATPR